MLNLGTNLAHFFLKIDFDCSFNFSYLNVTAGNDTDGYCGRNKISTEERKTAFYFPSFRTNLP